MQLAEVGLGVKGEPVAVGASLTGCSALVLVVNILARNFKTSVALTLDEAPLLLLLRGGHDQGEAEETQEGQRSLSHG